jgi:hypothetical protein
LPKQKTSWQDGTTQLIVSSLALMQRLATLVPPTPWPAPEKFA